MKQAFDSSTAGAWPDRLAQGTQVPRPGPVYGMYPLKELTRLSHSPMLAWLQAWWSVPPKPSVKQDRLFVQSVRQAQAQWAQHDIEARAHHRVSLRVQLATQGFDPFLTAQSFGLVTWVVQQHLGFELHDVQLQAASWMLGQRLVEMATGEGKTLTVLLTAATAAMAGVPVHVMTANDYLARRDAEQLRPIYAALGLSVAYVTAASTPAERQIAYRADVVHVTAKEVAFDHLRDRAVCSVGDTASVVLRGLCMAVVDEADGILIDEACTPLVLAGAADLRLADQRYRVALFLARQLTAPKDYVRTDGLQLMLTQDGKDKLETLTSTMKGEWRWQRYRHGQVMCALEALHVFQRDVHYLVRDEAIHIIDATTGRLAVGRSWSRGLHQMIAIKESVPPQPENETLTQTSYQLLFPRYLRLAGLSGTLYEDRDEMLRVYHLPMCRVPLRNPSQRVIKPIHVCSTAAQKWARVAERAQAESLCGRPVLIGTDTVADSDAVAAVLSALGLTYQMLNARQDEAQGQQETDVVAQAGTAGRITVATHMAGRGTDVHLSDEALSNGGLHVINTNLNRSRRIDRQLIGRCARQGTAGSCETILSWEDASWLEHTPKGWLKVIKHLASRGVGGRVLAQWLCRHVQMSAEARARRNRWMMLQTDAQMARQLALAGREDWD